MAMGESELGRLSLVHGSAERRRLGVDVTIGDMSEMGKCGTQRQGFLVESTMTLLE